MYGMLPAAMRKRVMADLEEDHRHQREQAKGGSMENVHGYQLEQFSAEALEAANMEVTLNIGGGVQRMLLGSLSVGQLRGVAALLNVTLPRVTLESTYGERGMYHVVENGSIGRGFAHGVWVKGPVVRNTHSNSYFKRTVSAIRKKHMMIQIARRVARSSDYHAS